MTRWFDLFNHNQYERKHCGWAWLIRDQALQFLWDLVHILMHALNNFSRPYGRLLLLEKPGSILLKVKNTKQKIILVLFIKMMTRQRIRANYCLKDLVTFYWMTKIQKIWICCLKQLGSILLNEKTSAKSRLKAMSCWHGEKKYGTYGHCDKALLILKINSVLLSW